MLEYTVFCSEQVKCC